jgi:threonine synthase
MGFLPPLSDTRSMSLQFHSTNGNSPAVDVKAALLKGQAPDRGLYMPERYPQLSSKNLASFREKSYAEIALEVLGQYFDGVIDQASLRDICNDAYDYEIPVELVHDRVHVMRLDRGPTASFKDFAARMMARLMGRFLREDNGELIILTATSGDTGSAVASAFHGVERTQVLVLFPTDEVSDRQRRQMTTLGGNIRSIAVDGKFDDCQALVKEAFADSELEDLPLSSANSINIGRLLPQSVYYFYAASRIADLDEPVVIAVPSGNFGNMMGAVIASKMGLPVKRLVVPVNENDEFPVFLETGDYRKIEPSRACISNAMNVGHPSNLARLVAVYGGWLDETGRVRKAPDIESMRRDLFSTTISDATTRTTIDEAWKAHKLLLEPHGAVGWRGFLDYAEKHPLDGTPAVVVETAHPAKFPGEIEKAIGQTPEAPESLARLDVLTEDFDRLDVDYDAFKNYLRARYC